MYTENNKEVKENTTLQTTLQATQPPTLSYVAASASVHSSCSYFVIIFSFSFIIKLKAKGDSTNFIILRMLTKLTKLSNDDVHFHTEHGSAMLTTCGHDLFKPNTQHMT